MRHNARVGLVLLATMVLLVVGLAHLRGQRGGSLAPQLQPGPTAAGRAVSGNRGAARETPLTPEDPLVAPGDTAAAGTARGGASRLARIPIDTLASDERATSGTAGGFVLGPGNNPGIGGTADDGTPTDVTAKAKPEGEQGQLGFAAISGRATTADGLPFTAFTLAWSVTVNDPAKGPMTMSGRERTIGPGGTYGFDVPGPGVLTLALEPEMGPYQHLRQPEPKRMMVLAGQTYADISFVVEQGETLLGRVVDAEGRPIEGAVAMAMERHQMLQSAPSDSDGKFLLAGVIKGRPVDSFRIACSGYRDYVSQGVVASPGEMQTFIMQRQLSASLRVTWSRGGQPVELYRYRLMRPAPHGLPWEAVSTSETIASQSGETELSLNLDGQWRAEVSVVGPGGEPTGLLAATDFEAVAGAKQTVEVSVEAGGIIRGDVLDDTGKPLEGAVVALLPPSIGFGRFGGGDPLFTVDPVHTEATGAFRFTSLPPGAYSLTAAKGELLTPQAVDVVIPVGSDPAPLKLVLPRGGTIFGKVIGEDGEPMSNVMISLAVQSANADGWNGGRETATDAAGAYGITGLPAGSHSMRAYLQGQPIHRYVNLAPAERKEENFNISGRIIVNGQVYVGGQPRSSGHGMARFAPSGQVQGATNATIQPDGRFQVLLPPGRYVVATESRTAGNAGHVEIAPEPAEQSLRVDFDLVTPALRLVYEGGEPPQPIDAHGVLSPVERIDRYLFIRLQVNQAEQTIPQVFAGRYQLTVSSRDKRWQGTSPWVDLAPGAANLFEVPMKRVATEEERVGDWVSDQLSQADWRTVSFDVSQHVLPDDALEVRLKYDAGRHAAEARWAGIALAPGASHLGRDEHMAWMGADHWANIYTFAPPPGGWPVGPLFLEVSMRSDGGTDSRGSVYLRPVPMP